MLSHVALIHLVHFGQSLQAAQLAIAISNFRKTEKSEKSTGVLGIARHAFGTCETRYERSTTEKRLFQEVSR